MQVAKLLMIASLTAATALMAVPAWSQDDAAGFDARSAQSFAGAVLAGRTAEADRDLDTAIVLYRKALGFEPTNADLKQRLMVLLFHNGMFDEGIAIAEDLQNDPLLENVSRMALGIDAIRQREYTRAQNLLDYDGISQLDRLIYGLLLAWAHTGDSDTDTALAMIDGLRGPDWYDIFKIFHRAAIEEMDGELTKARRLYTELVTDQNAAAAAPDTYMRAAMALAAMEARAGNRQKALDAIATAKMVATDYAPLTALRKRIEAEDPPDAEIRNPAQGGAAVLYTVGSALNRSGAEDYVSLYLNFARALDPENAATLTLLGNLAETLGKPETAIAIYREVPDDSVMHRLSQMQLGLNLADLERTEEAKTLVKQLIDEDPQDMRAYVAYGSVLSRAQSYREMADNYDAAVTVVGPLPDETHWNIFFQRGIAYERLKEWEKAEPNLKKALELSPEQPQVMNYLGYSWIDMNIHLDDGMELIREAVRLRPNDGYIIDSLGWAYYRLGEYDKAVTELERAVAIRPGDPTINDHLGDAYWRAGRRLEARYQWRRVLTMEPDLAEVPKIERKIDQGLPALADPAASTATAPLDESKSIDRSNGVDREGRSGTPTGASLTSYEVKPGQTLWTIAAEVLGDGNRYLDILQANPTLQGDADRIYPGQIINLP